MLVYGGFNCEGKYTLDDCCLFDLEVRKWIKTRVLVGSKDGHVVESGQLYGHKNCQSISDSDDARQNTTESIGPRRGHCMTAVFDERTLETMKGRG